MTFISNSAGANKENEYWYACIRLLSNIARTKCYCLHLNAYGEMSTALL